MYLALVPSIIDITTIRQASDRNADHESFERLHVTVIHTKGPVISCGLPDPVEAFKNIRNNGPFTLPISGIGVVGPSNDRHMALFLTPSPMLERLRGMAAEKCPGYSKQWEFKPHITLPDAVYDKDLCSMLSYLISFDTCEWR